MTDEKKMGSGEHRLSLPPSSKPSKPLLVCDVGELRIRGVPRRSKHEYFIIEGKDVQLAVNKAALSALIEELERALVASEEDDES